jgi:hypothetical protein
MFDTIFSLSGVQYVNLGGVQQSTGKIPSSQGQGQVTIARNVGFADWQSSVI